MTMHRNKLLLNKTNRSTIPNVFWQYNSTCFGQPLCPSQGVIYCKTGIGTFYAGVTTSCLQGQGGTAVPS